jgi:nondiscriminating aspartyl-tRNA synthetase
VVSRFPIAPTGPVNGSVGAIFFTTMKRTFIQQIPEKIAQTIRVAGWVHTIRNQGGIKFLLIRDITGIIQTVVLKDIAQASSIAQELTLESVVEVIGTVKQEKQAPGGWEVLVDSIKILSLACPELPIPILEKGTTETDLQKRLDWRWLDLRKPSSALIFKVWTEMERALREYWTSNSYLEIHSPKLMSTPSESGAELFEVKYFERKAYLAQSPQFYKQMAMAAGFERIFEVGPVFRANPSFTSRHDTEFTGYDIEISFIESHQDVMMEEQNALHYMLQRVKENFGEEILKHYGRELEVPSLPFPQLTMKEAKQILVDLKIESERDGDLSPEEERALSRFIKEERGHEFVFVTEYPAKVRAFYHMRSEENPALTKSFDLLWDGIEITTGAQREHRYDPLIVQAGEKGLSTASIQYYLDFFKYGCPPHGGCGMGPSRMLMKILNLANVREVTYLYRGVKRLTP